ncbi:MAG: zf-HC2 domain-containing protein [Terracidiphilus sp.]
MAERTHIPSSPACGEWEMLLADALDGLLSPKVEAKFAAHKADCPACAALYEEARKGREWLEFLAPEPEAPEGLLEKILAHTGPGHAAQAGWAVGGALPAVAGTAGVLEFAPQVWQQPGFFARMRYAMQPRLLMTAAMAFFSIALTLNMMGVRVTSLRLADLRPKAMRAHMERQLNMASVPIVRYYDHLRFVYEVESRVRELRNKAEGEGNGRPGENPQQHQSQPTLPGETRQNPGQTPRHNDGGWRAGPRQEPGNPAMEPAATGVNDFVETSFHFRGKRMQSGISAMRVKERSRVWIA